MPIMNGLELTKAIMTLCPLPILVVSSLGQKERQDIISKLLEAGVIDVHPKPVAFDSRSAEELISKIKVVAGVVPLRRRQQAGTLETKPERQGSRGIRMVAIGASVGGPQALNTVLHSLPASFPVPILCVQHIGAGFQRGLVTWLDGHCKLKIKTAEPGEYPVAGTAYFPREGTHLTVDTAGRLAASLDAAVKGHRPSVTVTFNSVASFYGSGAAGVLLTGMGEDGAEGLKTIADAGGLTIAQDEQSSVVFGMPRQAIELGAARYILPVGRIAEMLMAEVSQKQEQL